MLLRSLAALGLVGRDGTPSTEWLVAIAGQPGETIVTQFGTYKRVRLEGGAEIWIDIGADGTPKAGQVIGMTPFHHGVGAIKVEVRQTMALDPNDPLVGGWTVQLQALARGDRPLPITVEVVPFRLHATAAPTFTAYIRMLGLASEATVYPSAQAFLNRAAKSKLMSLGAVSPLCSAAGSMIESQAPDQRCVAVVTGRIEDARQIINPLSGQPYFWLLIATDRGLFNIVAGGRTLLGAAPEKGAIVQAKARLIATPAGPEALAERPDFTPPADLIRPGPVNRATGLAPTAPPQPAAASVVHLPRERRSAARGG